VTFTVACRLADLEEGTPYAATVGDVDVALVRDGEELYAIRDECSHAAIALSEGDVEGCTIECWLHGSAFDLRTGQPTSLPAFEPVPVYPVRVDGDEVLVDVENPLNTEELSA
jgi:3-phenylpropionate/trans-cinnamate dioxygenase ferredoxin component